MLLRLRKAVPSALIWLCTLVGCGGEPPAYAPPAQRPTATEPDPVPGLNRFVRMGDINAAAYIVRDIGHSLQGEGWRWASQAPEMRFYLLMIDDVKFRMEFALPPVTFKQTGPVTLSYFVNGKLLDRVAYDKPGHHRFERLVPREYLRPDAINMVAIQPDKLYVDKDDGSQLSFALSSAGFVR